MDKEGSKAGGYVGGFFQLFDWKAKSRKKLFASASHLPKLAKQGKRTEGNLPMTRLYLVDEDGTGVGSHIEGNDYSCASSFTDDEGYENRVPNVVARLMGLDTMPTSNSTEPYCTPTFETQCLHNSQNYRRVLKYSLDHQMIYSGNLADQLEGHVWSNAESKPHSQRLLNKPIEKFQTEVLPPKSAKSIAITQNKLLSPIKSPGFVPSMDAANIMEAAAKILEPGPQLSMKCKTSSLGSSSGCLKIRDTKENEGPARKISVVGRSPVSHEIQDLKKKADVAHRASSPAEVSQCPVDMNTSQFLKERSANKSWNRVDSSNLQGPTNKRASSTSKSKGKSISLAIQAKVNVQRREGISSLDRNLDCQQELNYDKFSQPFRNQPFTQKNSQKKSPAHNIAGFQRQNNQKENCLPEKERVQSKPSTSNSQSRRVPLGDSFGQKKTAGRLAGSSKAGSRKFELIGCEKDNVSSIKYSPSKKRSIDGELQSGKNRLVDDVSVSKHKKKVQSYSPVYSPPTWGEESRKNGMDVVSFTFMAPLARSVAGSDSHSQVNQKSKDYLSKSIFSQSSDTEISPLGYNMMDRDALSKFLGQKLQELSVEVDSNSHDSTEVDSTSSAPTFQDLSSAHNGSSLIARSRCKKDHFSSRLSSEYQTELSSSNQPAGRFYHEFQGVLNEKEHTHKAKHSPDYRPSPVSVLEPSFSTESCFSSDSMDSNITDGNKLSSSVQGIEIPRLSTSRKLHSIDVDMDLSDSASSLSAGRTATRKHAAGDVYKDLLTPNEWEIEYVKEILCNVELMFRDFTLGRAREIINPHLFRQLETRNGFSESNPAKSRLLRKELFDCVGECIDLRCRRYVGGGWRKWLRGLAMVRNERLAEDVCKEISGWRGSDDSMVDNLINKDMSNPNGEWREFDAEIFEIGLQIEKDILGDLVDEAIADVFSVRHSLACSLSLILS